MAGTLMVACALAGCASTPTAHSTHPSPTPTSGAGSAPTAVQAGATLLSTCSGSADASGDAAIRSVDLVTQDRELVVAFNLAQPISGDLTVSVAAAPGRNSSTSNADEGVSITATMRRGAPVSVTVAAPGGSASPSQVQDVVHVVDSQVHIGLPGAILEPLGSDWHWWATARSGADSGRCPADGADESSIRVVSVE